MATKTKIWLQGSIESIKQTVYKARFKPYGSRYFKCRQIHMWRGERGALSLAGYTTSYTERERVSVQITYRLQHPHRATTHYPPRALGKGGRESRISRIRQERQATARQPPQGSMEGVSNADYVATKVA
jgi:hypothetical protein